MPKRIKARWSRHHNLPKQDRYTYDIAPALKKAKIDTDEFNICWSYLNARLSSDEIFSLFYFGFSPTDPDVPGRLAFVRTVLKRYKDAKVFFGFYQYAILYTFVSCYVCIFACIDVIYHFMRLLIRPALKKKKNAQMM